jgi:hypothetical protein
MTPNPDVFSKDLTSRGLKVLSAVEPHLTESRVLFRSAHFGCGRQSGTGAEFSPPLLSVHLKDHSTNAVFLAFAPNCGL